MGNFEKFKQFYTSKKTEVDSAREFARKQQEDSQRRQQQQIIDERNNREFNIKKSFNDIGLIDLLDKIVKENIVRTVHEKKYGYLEYSPAIIKWEIGNPDYASRKSRSSVELQYDEGKYIEIDSDLVLHYRTDKECSVKLTKDNLEISIANALAENRYRGGNVEDNSWG